MSITLVQQIGSSSSTPTVTRTLNNVGAGNTLVVCFSCGANSASAILISDNNFNTWTIANTLFYNDTNNHVIGVAFVPKANGGSTTMTITNTQNQPIQANMSEFNTGILNAFLIVDQTATGTGNGTVITSSTVNTLFQPELLIAMIETRNGGLSAGAGFTPFSSPSANELPEYQIVTSTGAYAGTATGNSGIWGIVFVTFQVFIPIYNTIAGRFTSTINNLAGNLTVPIWTGSNLVPVTANSNVSTDQNLMFIVIPANTLNTAGRTLKIYCSGLYSTPVASNTTLEFKVTIGGLTLTDIVSDPNPGSVTNNGWIFEANISTQTKGTLAAFETSGKLTIDLGAAITSAGSTYIDTNTGTIASLDTTVNQTLQVTVAFANASGSNSATQRQMILQTVN